MTRRILLGLGFALALGLQPGAGAQESVGFRVIVHAGNPTAELSRPTAGNYFLKKQIRWPDGSSVEPVDQLPRATIRQAFSKAVLRRDVGTVLRYWQRQIFSGVNVPPPELASDAEVVAFVANRRGAIGYVSSNASLDGVRELRLTDMGGAP